MIKATIIRGGNAAFQMPAVLATAVPSTPIDGRAAKVFAWLLWEAHTYGRWPNHRQEPADLLVRHHAHDILAGAGLPRSHFRYLAQILAQLTELRCHGLDDAFVVDFVERPGRHVDIRLSAHLAARNWRPLRHYALLSMDHIRPLKTTLDVSLYARACQIARQRQPVFEIGLNEIAWLCNSTRGVEWRALRRQVLQSMIRICKITGGRIVVQAWCSGEFRGIDLLRCHVGTDGDPAMPRFPPKHGAIHFDIGPGGARRVDRSGAGKVPLRIDQS